MKSLSAYKGALQGVINALNTFEKITYKGFK